MLSMRQGCGGGLFPGYGSRWGFQTAPHLTLCRCGNRPQGPQKNYCFVKVRSTPLREQAVDSVSYIPTICVGAAGLFRNPT